MALAKTAMQMPNLRMPTGYESEQRKIEMKRRLAQAMWEQGIAPQNISSWTQVLAKLAQTWVGKSEDKKATKMEGAMYDRMQGDLVAKTSRLQKMRDAGASNKEIVDAFMSDPMMTEYIKPEIEAYGSGLKQREELFDTGSGEGFQSKGQYVGKPLPPDMNKAVYIDPVTKQAVVNAIKATASQAGQGLVSPRPGDPAGMITPVYSMPVPGSQPSAPATSEYAPQPRIPPGAMQMLIQNPNLAQQFDEKYGPGSAEEVIRSTGRPYQVVEDKP